jgi:hypothetical protein
MTVVDVSHCNDPAGLEHPGSDVHAFVAYDARGNIASVVYDRPPPPGGAPFSLCQ